MPNNYFINFKIREEMIIINLFQDALNESELSEIERGN